VTGVVLAGGRARRMGGESKAALELAGRALVDRPLEALASVCGRVAVVCKPATLLPTLPAGVERWQEPAEPVHPLAGLTFALRHAGEEVLVCAADMPFVGLEELQAMKEAARDDHGARAVVAEAGGRLEPLLAVYRPTALAVLREAPERARLTAVVERLEPVRVAVPEAAVRSVNTPEELAAAEAELAG